MPGSTPRLWRGPEWASFARLPLTSCQSAQAWFFWWRLSSALPRLAYSPWGGSTGEQGIPTVVLHPRDFAPDCPEFLCLFGQVQVLRRANRRRRNSTCCWIGTSGGPVRNPLHSGCWRRHEQSSRSSKRAPTEQVTTSSFSLGQRCGRMLANLLTFGDMVTRPYHGWRRFVLRCLAACLHPTSRVYPGFVFGIPPT